MTHSLESLTVVGCLTAPGRSALATLAILGPDARRIASSLFVPAKGNFDLGADPGPYYGQCGHDPSDDVVLAETVSTGDVHTIEIHCHGGAAMVAALLEQIRQQGAAIVTWQEIAHRQGNSQIQIEATEALARCRTKRTAAILLDQVNGSLDRALQQIESAHDMSLARELRSWARFGQHLVEPWHVLLIGPPNVGKSSLLNALVGHERAIVSAEAGTTRDVIRGEISIDGWPFMISDGAGIRTSSDEIEQAGISMLEREATRADLCVFVHDLSQPRTTQSIHIERVADQLQIGSKADLPSPWTEEEKKSLDAVVSAMTGERVESLLQNIAQRLVPMTPTAGQAIPFNQRQIDVLDQLLNNDPKAYRK